MIFSECRLPPRDQRAGQVFSGIMPSDRNIMGDPIYESSAGSFSAIGTSPSDRGREGILLSIMRQRGNPSGSMSLRHAVGGDATPCMDDRQAHRGFAKVRKANAQGGEIDGLGKALQNDSQRSPI